jgi:hypothetical protein
MNYEFREALLPASALPLPCGEGAGGEVPNFQFEYHIYSKALKRQGGKTGLF